MTSVCLQVRAIAVLRRAVKVVILLDQAHKLVLNVGKLLYWEFVLVRTHFLQPQEAEEAELVLEQEQKGAATTVRATARTTNTMDIVIRIIRRVELNDPVDLREIKTSLGDIRAEKNARLSLAEFEIGRCALLLLLLAMDVLHWDIDVVEQV